MQAKVKLLEAKANGEDLEVATEDHLVEAMEAVEAVAMAVPSHGEELVAAVVVMVEVVATVVATVVLSHGKAVEVVEDAAVPSDGCPTVSVQPDFNASEFVQGGKWYIQQQMAVKYLPSSQNFCVTAEYSYTDASRSKVHVANYANEGGVNGKVYDSDKQLGILGGICGDIDDPSQPAKLAVGPCNLPKWIPGARGPYWVLAAGPSAANYEWALISGGQPTHEAAGGCRTGTGINDSGLWIFTRKAARDEAVVTKLRSIAHEKGFDLSVLADVEQAGCTYKPA